MPFLFINKPAGWTSHDVVAHIRTDKKIKVGHAGTLDPFATGLLIVGVGRDCTKKLDEFKQLPKTYIATIKLGATSDTYDKTGKISEYQNPTKDPTKIPDKKTISSILKSFIGKQLQTPPMFSAKKINGQRLYKLARQGKTIERQPNEIEIYEINLLDYSWPILKIEVKCSTGTYIRSLANDIGEKLGIGAYCEELERTAIGENYLKNAINLT
ncbi:MAG: tRNA pseudouridine(55) synthase TruB [Patescibacteria group bacterium]